MKRRAAVKPLGSMLNNYHMMLCLLMLPEPLRSDAAYRAIPLPSATQARESTQSQPAEPILFREFSLRARARDAHRSGPES